MNKFKRILGDRKFSTKSKPFDLLEKRVTEAFILERRVAMSNFSQSNKNQSDKQFIVYLVSCFESYLRDIFKLMIDQQLIPITEFMKFERLKNLKLNLLDIEKAKKEKITISEIIVNELSFQNFNEILKLCFIIDFDKYYPKLIKKIHYGNVGFTKKESDEAMLNLKKMEINKIEWLKKQYENKDNPFDDEEIAQSFFKSIVRIMYRGEKPKKEELCKRIKMAIKLRHKIVHRAVDIKIHPVVAINFLLDIILFSAIIQEIYNIKSGKLKSLK